MKFFKEKDFEGPAALNRWVKHGSYEYKEILKFVVERANEKLKSKGTVVYTTQVFTNKPPRTWFLDKQIDDIHGINWSTHQALLIGKKRIK